MEKGRIVEFECLRCDARHKEAYNLRKNAHCKSCGNVAYPVEDLSQPVKKGSKKCRGCGSSLRQTNNSSYCSSCDR